MRSKTAFTVKPKKKTSPSAIPFMRETEIASFRMAAFTVGRSLPRNWCGTTCSTFFVRVFVFPLIRRNLVFYFVGFIYSSAFPYYTFVRMDFSLFHFYSSPSILRHRYVLGNTKLLDFFFLHYQIIFFHFKYIFLTYPNQHA
jgi:hypothetical protein